MRHLGYFILVLSDSCFLNFWNHPCLSSKTWVLLERRCHTSLISNTGVGVHLTYLYRADGCKCSFILLKIFCPALSSGNVLLSLEWVLGPERFPRIGHFCLGHLLPEHTAPIVPPTKRALRSLFQPAIESWLFSCMHFTFGGANFCLVLLVLLIWIGNMYGWFIQTCFQRVSEMWWKEHLVKKRGQVIWTLISAVLAVWPRERHLAFLGSSVLCKLTGLGFSECCIAKSRSVRILPLCFVFSEMLRVSSEWVWRCSPRALLLWNYNTRRCCFWMH